MKHQILATLIILCIANTAFAGTGFEPVTSGAVDDVVNKTVNKDTLDKTSDRLSKFGDIYGSAKTVPENIKQAATGTKTAEAAPKKKGLTFWQEMDRLIMKTRNSNY